MGLFKIIDSISLFTICSDFLFPHYSNLEVFIYTSSLVFVTFFSEECILLKLRCHSSLPLLSCALFLPSEPSLYVILSSNHLISLIIPIISSFNNIHRFYFFSRFPLFLSFFEILITYFKSSLVSTIPTLIYRGINRQ